MSALVYHPVIHRHDKTVQANYRDNYGAPCYYAEIGGSLVYCFIDTPHSNAPKHMRSIPAGSAYLVGFAPACTPILFRWAHQGGAATYADAEALLEELAAGRPGEGFIVPINRTAEG